MNDKNCTTVMSSMDQSLIAHLRHTVILLVAMIAMSITSVQASHIVGGHLSYTCLGNNSYEIVFTLRRDCLNGDEEAPFDDPAQITVFDEFGNILNFIGLQGIIQLPFVGSSILEDFEIDPCLISGSGVCVEETVYRRVITLPPTDRTYILVYQRCCRNVTLNNIVQPIESGASYTLRITPEALQACSDGPQVEQWPEVYRCASEPFSFDYSATESNGDSIVYQLCAPKLGANIDFPKPINASRPPYDDVVYASGYSGDSPFGNFGSLTIDPASGQINGQMDLVGQYLVGICISEFRDGALLSSSLHDFQYNIVNCGDNVSASFQVENTICGLDAVSFQNSSNGADQFTWFFDAPNTASFSNEENPSFTYSAAGIYTVRLIASNSVTGCVDEFEKQIEVLADEFAPEIDLHIIECQEEALRIRLSIVDADIQMVNWTIDVNGDISNSDERSPELMIPSVSDVSIQANVLSSTDCTAQVFREQSFTGSVAEDQISFDIISCDGDEFLLVFSATNDQFSDDDIVMRNWFINQNGSTLALQGPTAEISASLYDQLNVTAQTNYGSSCVQGASMDIVFSTDFFVQRDIEFQDCSLNDGTLSVLLTDRSAPINDDAQIESVQWEKLDDNESIIINGSTASFDLNTLIVYEFVQTVTYNNGCKLSESFTIDPMVFLGLDTDIDIDIIDCTSTVSTIQLRYDFPQGNEPNTLDSFHWFVTQDGDRQSVTGISPMVEIFGEDILIELELTLKNGCQFSLSDSLLGSSIRLGGFELNDIILICEAATETRLFESINADVDYVVNPTDGLDFSDGTNNPVATLSGVTYTLDFISEACPFSRQVTVSQASDYIPIIRLVSGVGNVVCGGDLVLDLVLDEIGPFEVQWSLDDSFTEIIGTESILRFDQSAALQDYFVRLVLPNGCISAVSSIQIENKNILDDIQNGDELTYHQCDGDKVRLLEDLNPDLDYTISPDDDLDFSNGPNDPTVLFQDGARYDIRATDGTCDVNFFINLASIESLEIDIRNLSMVEQNCSGIVNLLAVAESDSDVHYEWSLDESFSEIINQSDTLSLEQSTDFEQYFVRVRLDDECVSRVFSIDIRLELFDIIGLDADTIERVACDEFGVALLDGFEPGLEYQIIPDDDIDFTDVNNPIANPTETTTYLVIGSDGVCTDSASVEVLIADDIVPSIVNLSSGSSTDCDGLVSLTANIATSADASIEWSTSESFDPIIATGDTLRVEQSIDQQVYFVRSRFDNGCTSSVAQISIERADFDGDTVDVEDYQLFVCSGVDTRLIRDFDPNFQYEISPLDGLDFSDSDNPLVLGIEDRSYTISITNSECSKTITVDVFGSQSIKPIISSPTGNAILACNGNVVLFADDGSGEGQYQWSDSPVFGNILSDDQTLEVQQSADFALYFVRVIYPGGCESGIASINVERVDQDLDGVDMLDLNVGACADTPVRLLSNVNPDYSYEITPIDGLDFSDDDTNPLALPDTTTSYMVTISDGFCTEIVEITVFRTEDVVPSFVDIDGNQTMACNGDVSVSAIVPIDNASYIWSSNENFSDTLSTDALLELEQSDFIQTYFVKVIFSNGCESKTASITVSLFNQSFDNMLAGDTLVVCRNSGVRLLNSVDEALTYEWSPLAGLDFSDDPNNPLALPLTDQAYTVTVAMGECSEEFSVAVVRESLLDLTIDGSRIICSDQVSLTAQLTGNPEVVEWSTDMDFGNIISSDATLLTSQTIDQQTYFLRFTYGNGCTVSDSVSVTRASRAFFDFPDFAVFCELSDQIELNPNGDPSLEYTWSPSGLLDFSNGGHNPIFTNPFAQDFMVTITDGSCSKTETLSVIPSEEYIVGLDESNLLESCDGNIMLRAIQEIPGLIQWSENISFIPAIEGSVFDINIPPGIDTVYVRQLFNDGCISKIRPIEVRNSSIVFEDINLGAICAEDTVTISLVSQFPEQQINVRWDASPNIITDLNQPTIQIITDAMSDSIDLSYTATNLAGCFLNGNVSIDISASDDAPTFTFGKEDCEPFRICFDSDAIDGSVQWDFGDTSVESDTSDLAQVCYIYPSEGTFTATLSSTRRTCGFDMISFDVVVAEPLMVMAEINGLDICQDQSISLSATANDENASYQWLNGAGDLIGSDALLTDYVPNINETIIIVQATDADNCTDRDTVQLNLFTFDLEVVSEFVVCPGEPQDLELINNDPGRSYTYIWSPSDCIVEGQGTTSPTVSAIDEKVLSVLVTEVSSGCTTERLINIKPADINVEIMTDANDDTIFEGQDVILQVENIPGYTFDWSTGETTRQIIASPVETTTFMVLITDENGCSVTEEITIFVIEAMCNEEDIYLPSAFTPNNDGANDVFIPRSNFIESVEFFIVDRWGNEVFRTTEVGTGWNGRLNNSGDLLAADAYAYCLLVTCVDGSDYVATGNVSLIK